MLLVLNIPLVGMFVKLLSDGDWGILWGSPLAIGLWVVAGLGLVLPYLVGPILRRRMNAAMKESPVSD